MALLLGWFWNSFLCIEITFFFLIFKFLNGECTIHCEVKFHLPQIYPFTNWSDVFSYNQQ